MAAIIIKAIFKRCFIFTYFSYSLFIKPNAKIRKILYEISFPDFFSVESVIAKSQKKPILSKNELLSKILLVVNHNIYRADEVAASYLLQPFIAQISPYGCGYDAVFVLHTEIDGYAV